MRESASALLDKLFPERTLGEDRALIEQEQRAQTGIAEEALGIHSIDADDPRFKLHD